MLDTQYKERRMCDCKKQECPVNGCCLMENIIYKATVITDNQTKFYVGSTGLSSRYTKHKYIFKHEKHKNTQLYQYSWKLKNNEVNFKIQWEILTRTKNKYSLKNGCKLCNAEKIETLKVKKSESLNKRNELQTGCIHYRKQFI